MYKKFAILSALFTILVPIGSADAALFNWLYKKSENSFIVGSGSSVDRALNSIKEKSEEAPEEEEKHSTVPAYNFDGWLDDENIPAPPLNKFSSAPAKQTFIVVATAYSSTPDQTDDTPFVTARNTRVRDGLAAANFLPFGTEFRIPDLYGDKIFVVEDRMNKRYWHRVDVWFPEREMALEFGIKQIRIEIVS